MSVSLTALLLVSIAVAGGALALAGFVWAVRQGHLDPGNSGANAVFDEDELAGRNGAGEGRGNA